MSVLLFVGFFSNQKKGESSHFGTLRMILGLNASELN